MKNVFMSLAIAILTITGVQAQENKTLKKESTIKRVVTKEGSDVKIKEIRDTKKESGAVNVKNDNNTNQEFSESSTKGIEKEILKDDVSVDERNKALIAENKKKQEAELEASRRYQEELAAKRKMEFEQKKEQMQRDMDERRANLEARPKRMSKLNKN